MIALLIYSVFTLIIVYSNRYILKKLKIINDNLTKSVQPWKLKAGLYAFTFMLYCMLTHYIFFPGKAFCTPFQLLMTLATSSYTYMFFLFVVVDISKYIVKRKELTISHKELLTKIYQNGITVCVIALLLSCYGMWNANHIAETHYNLKIAKSADYENIKIAMISDLQIGSAIRENRIKKLREKLVAENPDILLINGKLISRTTSQKRFLTFLQEIKKVEAPLGKYYILTDENEPLISERKIQDLMSAVGIMPLKNKCIQKDGIYIAGIESFRTETDLRDIHYGLDSWKPLIVITNESIDKDTLKKLGVSLLLRSQGSEKVMFPINLITAPLSYKSYGKTMKGNTIKIVTSGCGTREFPIRVKGKNEIIYIDITFTGDTTSAEENSL
ncbi:MAG: hypothetical protein RR272_00620 [Synergistaceae bacterium]